MFTERVDKLVAASGVRRGAPKLFTFAVGKQCVGWRAGEECADLLDGRDWRMLDGKHAGVDG